MDATAVCADAHCRPLGTQAASREHLQLMREQMDLLRAAPASLGVATLSAAAPAGNGHTVVFGEGSDGAGTLAMHKVITDRLGALEVIIDQMIEREAFDSELAHGGYGCTPGTPRLAALAVGNRVNACSPRPHSARMCGAQGRSMRSWLSRPSSPHSALPVLMIERQHDRLELVVQGSGDPHNHPPSNPARRNPCAMYRHLRRSRHNSSLR